MLCCRIWLSAPSFWMGDGLESLCVGRVYGAGNHMMQLNLQCAWWWAYVPETCRAKNSLIKLPCCIKLAFQVISRVILSVPCVVQKLTYRTNPTCTAIYAQEMHKTSFYMVRHSMSAIIRQSSRSLKYCFRKCPLYAAVTHLQNY